MKPLSRLCASMLLGLSVLLTACSTTYRQPVAAGLPDEDLATLLVDFCPGGRCLILGAIDDVSRGAGIFSVFKLKPGVRKFHFGMALPGRRSEEPMLLEIDAKKGQTYRARAIVDASATHWYVEVIDEATGRVVSRRLPPDKATNDGPQQTRVN